jgi:fumarate reductase flavoprotein subunit
MARRSLRRAGGAQSTVPTAATASRAFHSVGEQGGASLLTILARAASHHTHIRIRTTTEVERLLSADGGGIGGVALRPDRRGATTIRGPVALACGGFVADDELVARHAPDVAPLPYLGPAGAKGDALRLAAGAATRNLAAVTVTALLSQPSHLVVTRAVIAQGGVLVNQRGDRFTDESADSLPLATAIRAQPGKVAYLLFDERIATAVGDVDPFFARVVLPRTSRRASSLGMLSKQLELLESGLARTIETVRATTGADAFGRTRTGGPIGEPYYGIRVTGARRATRGGLAVDTSARVVGDGGRRLGPTPSAAWPRGSLRRGDGDLAGVARCGSWASRRAQPAPIAEEGSRLSSYRGRSCAARRPAPACAEVHDREEDLVDRAVDPGVSPRGPA